MWMSGTVGTTGTTSTIGTLGTLVVGALTPEASLLPTISDRRSEISSGVVTGRVIELVGTPGSA